MAPGLLFNFVLMKILLASFGHIYKCALIGDINKTGPDAIYKHMKG